MSELSRLARDLQVIYSAEPWHGPSLAEILEDISDEEAVARPFPGVHSIGEIVLHIAGWQEVCQLRLQGAEVNDPPEGDFPEGIEWSVALARLEQSNRRMILAISALAEEVLDTTVAHKNYTVRFMLHGVIDHCVYHSGQISLLRKALRSGRAADRI